MQAEALERYEKQAMEQTLRDLGSYVVDVGMDKPMKDYSKDEILGLVRVCVFHTKHYLANLLELNDEVPF